MEAQNNLKDRLSSFGLKRSVGRDDDPWDLNDLMRVKKRTSEKSQKTAEAEHSSLHGRHRRGVLTANGR